MSIFGSNIKTLRNSLQLSQQEFGELFSLSRGSIGSYEEGRADPKIDSLVKISSHFNLSIDDLLKKKLNPKGTINLIEISEQEKNVDVNSTTTEKIYLEDRVEKLEEDIAYLNDLLKKMMDEQ
ncbi:MAG: helix-turn-helix transcriptional regulator [Chitinophagales bacterium]|nr:helix-turn-helix transcriptional regulator [Chitinophagales bacterium]